MADNHGPRFPPRAPEPSLAPEDEPPQAAGGVRPEYESVDLEEVEEIHPSVEELPAIDIEIEEDVSVDGLLAITGEGWSLDAQREHLKAAAKHPEPEREPSSPGAPSVSIPTPYDFGALAAERLPAADDGARTTLPRAAPRSMPPPLPGAPASASPPPLPAAASASPPPLPAAASASPPPLPDAAAAAPPPAPLTGSAPPPPARSVQPPPRSPQRGASMKPGPPSRKPPPLPKTDTAGPAKAVAPEEPARSTPEGHALVELLTARIARLEGGDDRVGLARANVELAIVHETLGNDSRVNAAAEAALAVDADLAPAHAILRRRIHHRSQLVPMLRHLDREIAVSAGEASTVELLAERARLLAAGDRADDAREGWELVLTRAPNHAAALKGLEADLWRRAFLEARPGDRGSEADPDRWEDLVSHLGSLADAYSAEPSLAAWLHLERAHLLEQRLGRVEAARGAFERALRLDPSVGPVRAAFTLHCFAHHDIARAAELLSDEAALEPSPSRCARLELDAACLLHTLLEDDARAIELLERAAARAPTTPSVDRRVLDDLVRLYEANGQWPEAARSRRARLRFFTDAATQVYELRRLATIEERLGNVEDAAFDIERALHIDVDDPTLLDELDRLLALAGKDEERIALWHGHATRTGDGRERARALAKAAQLAEELGQPKEALRHLRAAWVAAPGDAEILDHLSRLMSPPPSDSFDREVRALIELYSQAAQATADAGRRVAYLEKVALLWEEVAGDQLRATRTYEEILRLEPGRRGAVLGLERTAGRIGDDRALSRALAEEAKLAEGDADVLALRVRSAQVLARVDAPRAASLVEEVLEHDPQHPAARALEARLHAEAGRWELAAQSIRARIEIATSTKDKVSLWLELAQIYDARLRDPTSAVAALQQARAADPVHPVPPEEIARVLAAAGDARALREAIERLADDAITPQERARHLTRAGEIDELRLSDDASAAALYTRALAETPEDELVAERLVRVLARRVVTTAGEAGPKGFEVPAWGELMKQLASRAQKATTPAQSTSYSFQLASLLVAANHDLPRARGLLEPLSDAGAHHVGVLRLLEAIARRAASPQPLAEVLEQQGDRFTDVRARLGALWELASLEAWRLSSGESIATYTRILELDPTDPSALDAAVRLTLGPARRGELPARRAAIAALRSVSALAHEESTRLASDLRLGLLLEAHANDPTLERDAVPMTLREALERQREVLSLDPLSVTAATSLARLANRLGDVSGAAVAAISLAELSVQPKVRAKYLVDAANLLLSEGAEEALGPREERAERAAQLLEQALAADPNSKLAATRLSQVRAAQGTRERLVDVFRSALANATAKDTIVFVGAEIAKVARDDLGDVSVAIEAMRGVREAAPDHIPSLLTLSELFIAQRAWPEAVDALEDIVTRGKEAAPRMTALFALASVYEKVLGEAASAERSLRTALSIEPENARAIRALIHRLAAKQSEPTGDGQEQKKTALKLEIASLLDRLAHVEDDAHVKCDILLELADIRIALSDMALAEKAIVEALATAPDHARAFARLSRFFRSPENPGPGGLDAVSYARALTAVIGRGQQLGTSDPQWYATLGQIEIDQLNRLRDGVANLRRAVEMAPTMYECRFQLAKALSRLGAHDDAAKVVLAMMTPNAAPLVSIADTGAALELLERAFNAERRHEEAIVVSELRAIAGELDDGRQSWLRARRLPAFEQHHAALDRATLVSHLVPSEARHVLLDIAAAISGVESKLLRADLTDIGVSPRERIGRRSGHPTRALLDRLARALGIGDVELVVTPNVTRTRVIAYDGVWVLVPSSLAELPEPTQLASLGRALARVALNVPWLEELPPSHIEALLVAAARAVNPSYGQEDVDVLSLKLVAQYEPSLVKELTRKQRQALDKLVPLMGAPQGRMISIDLLIGALACAELRIAYVLTGDVLATVDELRGLDAGFFHATESAGRSAVGAVLDHPFAGDVVRFALTPEATALRRRVGSTWAG